MKRRLIVAGFLVALATPAFGANVTLKGADKVDNFRDKCLNPAEDSTVQIVGQCEAGESSFVVFFKKYQSHPCVASTPDVCKKICDPPGPHR